MTSPTHAFLDTSPLWTKQRCELVQWLDDNAPTFTGGYVAAVRLVHQPTFPASVHLVCHLVRDIYRNLPTALGVKPSPRYGEVFPEMIHGLVTAWDASPANESITDQSLPTEVRLDPRTYRQVRKIVEKSKELGQPARVGTRLATALFRAIERRQEEFIPPHVIKSFDLEFDFFVARAHLSMNSTPSAEGMIEHFESFERSFHSLVGRYFTGKEELDAILRDANATTD